MAKIGLLGPRYCKLTETEANGVITETLGTGKIFAKAIKANISVKTSDAKQYADDGVTESVKEFISGLMTFESNDIEDTVKGDIHGAAVETETGDIVYTTGDVAPYLRFGFVVREVKNGILWFRGIVYMKIQFGLPNEEYATKGESIEYKSTTEVADIMRNKDTAWKREKACTTLPLALTYVNSLTNMSGT